MEPRLSDTLRALARGDAPWPLYLWSAGPGTGKTSAALALLDHAGPPPTEKRFAAGIGDVLAGFVDFGKFPGLLRAAGRDEFWWNYDGVGGTVTPTGVWEALTGAGRAGLALVVVDDLRLPGDKEKTLGDDHYGCLKRLLDERVGRPLVVTSNLDPFEPPGGGAPELVRATDDRVADRLTCGTVYELAGASRRGT